MSKCGPDRHRRRYTPSEDAEIIAAAVMGRPWALVARKQGRSRRAVAQRATDLRRAGVVCPRKQKRGPRRPWPDADKQRVKDTWDGGGSMRELAAALGRTENAVRSMARALGCEVVQKHHRPHERKRLTARVLHLLDRGCSLEDIGEELDVHPDTVRRWAKAAGRHVGRRPPRPWTLAEDDRLRRGCEANEPTASMAADLDRTTKSVEARRRKLGLVKVRKSIRQGWTAAELRRAADMRDNGVHPREIGKALGRSESSVRGALAYHGRRR